MIIVLKGADFSQNNIGKVQTEIVLDEYTKAAILASGNDALTDIQKSALNSLFLAMGVDGSNNVMSKIRKMYLPMIAGDVSKALINYADNTFPEDATPNSADWELRNMGIAQKTTNQVFNLTLDSPLLATNFTQMWLRTENMESGVHEDCRGTTLRGKTNLNNYLGLTESSSTNDTAIAINVYGFTGFGQVIKTVEQRTVSGISYRAANDISKQIYGTYSLVTDGSIVANVDMSGESSQYLYLLGLNGVTAPRPFGFMLLGEAIADEDFRNIRDKVNELYAAMKG